MAIDREATLKNAEKFLRVGRLDAAIAEYLRVVEDQPRDWNTANTLGDLYMRAGQSGKAVPLYSRVASHLLAEGFYSKAGALFRKILKIIPDDEDTQLRLAEISERQGLLADAKQYYSTIEKRRREQGNTRGADEIVVRLGNLDPEDLDARLSGARAAERSGPVEASRQYRELYEEFLKIGRQEDADRVLRDCVRCDPEQRASSLLPLARIELREGHLDEARGLLRELLAANADSHRSVLDLANELAAGSPQSAALCVDAVADTFVAAGEFSRAAAALQEFSSSAPSNADALLRLVEVCVDGGLETLMLDAQAKLADAYLAAGGAAEARVIAEDLVAREPGNATHIERLRRALRALNVEDVDASIAERVTAAAAEDPDDIETAGPPVAIAPPPAKAPTVQAEPVRVDERPPPAPASVEIDLTGLLVELQGQVAAPEPPVQPPQDLERVFSEIRAGVGADEDTDSSADHFDLARTYLEMGLRDEAIGSLQVAARSPRHRFAASSMIAEIYRDDGDLRAAIEWFERAIETPASDAEQGRALLYDLGDLLETVGETARALAVFLELNADRPDYRDVSERVARLARVETEG